MNALRLIKIGSNKLKSKSLLVFLNTNLQKLIPIGLMQKYYSQKFYRQKERKF